MLLLAGLVDVVVQVRVHALADAQARVVEDSALFEGNVRARHSGNGFAFRVGDELAHPHGFVGAAFDLPILVLAQSLVSCAIVSHVVPRFCASRVFSEHGAPFLWYDRG